MINHDDMVREHRERAIARFRSVYHDGQRPDWADEERRLDVVGIGGARDMAYTAIADLRAALSTLDQLAEWAFTSPGQTPPPADVWPGLRSLLEPYRPSG